MIDTTDLHDCGTHGLGRCFGNDQDHGVNLPFGGFRVHIGRVECDNNILLGSVECGIASVHDGSGLKKFQEIKVENETRPKKDCWYRQVTGGV